jgi:GTP-binding protein HflX
VSLRLRSPSPALFIGKGKAEELAAMAKEDQAEVIVFDSALSPAQQRNWEELAGMAVIDRQEVILEVFADRAHTREAVLQVALARMEYSLPRLTRAWTHLSRQRGKGSDGGRGRDPA